MLMQILVAILPWDVLLGLVDVQHPGVSARERRG